MAFDAKAGQIDNSNFPGLPTLHEADISDMEYFLDQIKLIMPVMGFNFLISTTANKKLDTGESSTRITFLIKSKSFKAKMQESDQGYIVLKGSTARKTLTNSCTKTYRIMRKKLLETKIMIDQGDKLVFAEDAVFSSPSAASNMILGRNSNGLEEWITSEGLPFKIIQQG